jgi:hypothetical protein
MLSKRTKTEEPNNKPTGKESKKSTFDFNERNGKSSFAERVKSNIHIICISWVLLCCCLILFRERLYKGSIPV